MSTTDDQDRRVIAGRYVLRGLLGQGGMADVELAYDEILDRQVAVKMLHERYVSDDSFVDRFRREAQSAAALNHPNVVGVYDTGADDGRPYIVMEYIAGRTLSEIMKREGVLPVRAAEIAAEAAEALHFAHERGIVHRDIKPGNIMIGEDGRVKVTDFGIARAVNVESVTQTSSIFGTAAYVAPEQAQGQRVDGRTDIYALGCVLFEMVTGQQPFSGDSAVALAYKHVSEAPPTPRSLNAEISPGMESVVLKALAKDPAQRYQTGKDMAADLRRASAGQPVSTNPEAAFAATQAIPRSETAAVPAPAANPTLVAAQSDLQRPREEYYTEERSSNPGRLAAYAFLVILIAALIGIAAYLFTGVTGNDDEPVELVAIPQIIGLDQEEAQAQLVAVGLQPEFGTPEEDSEAPPNSVLRTDPPVGTEVELNSTVVLILSAGRGTVVIPSVEGMTQAEAEEALRALGLEIDEVIEEGSDEIDEGLAIRTQPAAGIQVEEGQAVTLVISEGQQTFEMPFVIDLTAEDARERIENACDPDPGDVCALVQVSVDTTRSGDPRVIESDPAEGEEVDIGQVVTIVLPTEPTPTPTPIPVPEPTPPPEPQPIPTPEPINPPEPTPTPEPVPPPEPVPEPPSTPDPVTPPDVVAPN